MEVQTPPRPPASFKSPASTAMTTPRRQMRIPLGELPISDFVVRTNASPILKPLRSSTPRKASSAVGWQPATPPHSATKPINIRPHHPHVYHSPSGALQDARSQSPSPNSSSNIDVPELSSDASRPRSDSSSSSRSDLQGPAPLPRKRDRINPSEVAQARAMADQPIPGSPSPRKQPEAANHAQSRHHRRNSSTASLTDFMKQSSKRDRTGSFGASAHTLLLGENSSSSSMCVDDDDGQEDDQDEPVVQVTPMKLVPSPKTGTSRRPSLTGRTLFGEPHGDIFGVNCGTDTGSLLVFQDVIEEEPESVHAPSSPSNVKRRRLSSEACGDDDDDDDMDLLDKENVVPRNIPKRPGSKQDIRLSRNGSTSSSGSSSASGSMSSFFQSSDDDVKGKVDTPGAVTNKRKGTGGRLSLLASALDSDADSSRESV